MAEGFGVFAVGIFEMAGVFFVLQKGTKRTKVGKFNHVGVTAAAGQAENKEVEEKEFISGGVEAGEAFFFDELAAEF